MHWWLTIVLVNLENKNLLFFSKCTQVIDAIFLFENKTHKKLNKIVKGIC